MARLLSIASAVLAFAGCTALAQGVCPTQLSSYGPYFYFSYDGVESDDYKYFTVSLTTPDDSDESKDGCSANPVYISQFGDDGDSCTEYAATRVGNPTPLPTGCLYEFTTNQDNTYVFNMSCYDSGVGFDNSYADITTINGKNRTYFTGYGDAFCTPVSTGTVTYTDGPTQTQTDAPVINYSYVSFYTSTSYESYLESYIRTFLNVTSSNSYGTIEANCGCNDGSGNYTCITAFSNETQASESIFGGTHGYINSVFNASWYTSTTNYTNITFLYYYSYASYLKSDIRSFLNISSSFDCWGTLTTWCNSTRVGGSYTCVGTFSNYTQAYLSYEGGNRGYISDVYGAALPGFTPTTAPSGTTQTATDGPTQTNAPPANITYSYVSFYTSTYYESYLVSYIRDFLNVTYSTPYGIVDVSCPDYQCRDGSGNYTCIATFSNESQAYESVFGGTHGYIYSVFNASWYNASNSNYTNVTFQYRYSTPSYLKSDIRSFLNISSNFDCWGTLTVWCNSTIVGGNYTCNATFSNYTQAYLSYEGANRRYISDVYGATMPGFAPTTAPNGGHNGDESKSKAPVIIGVIIGIVVVVALVGVAVVVMRRRSQNIPEEEGTQLNNVLDSR